MTMFEFTQQQVNNLKEFLKRVTLKGSEAVALTQIMLVLEKPVADQAPLKPKEESKPEEKSKA